MVKSHLSALDSIVGVLMISMVFNSTGLVRLKGMSIVNAYIYIYQLWQSFDPTGPQAPRECWARKFGIIIPSSFKLRSRLNNRNRFQQ
jgi:hypothetical protein